MKKELFAGLVLLAVSYTHLVVRNIAKVYGSGSLLIHEQVVEHLRYLGACHIIIRPKAVSYTHLLSTSGPTYSPMLS